MKITGTHSNFAAQAWAAREYRAGRLANRNYHIAEIEALYNAAQ